MILNVSFEESLKIIEFAIEGDGEIISPEFEDFIIMTPEIPPEGYEFYYGDYTLTPTLETQRLETEMKIMRNDVTVKAIPHYSTGNISGGNTVYIATEV